MPDRHARLLLSFVVAFGFFVRAATARAPLLDHHAWRQADTAAIARNFARDDYNILHPQIDWRGPQPTGRVETGLELGAFIVATIWRVSGVNEAAGRLLSALAFVVTALCTWTFVRRRYGEETALVAAYVSAFGLPLLLYMERSFMNEALLVALSIGTLAAGQIYLDTRRVGWWVAVCALAALLGAIKLPYLIVLAPLAGLLLERHGWRAATRWELWSVAIASLAASAAWYAHAHQLRLETGFTFGLSDKVLDFGLLASTEYVRMIVQRLGRDLLGPIGLVAFLIGLAAAWRGRRWCEVLGVAGFLVYLALVPIGNFVHDYYQIALMPLAPGLIALGLMAVRGALPAAWTPRADGLTAAALILIALSTGIRLSDGRSWFNVDPDERVFCERASALGAPSERVMFIAYFSDPKLLYCIDRKGWVLASDQANIPHVTTAKAEGLRWIFFEKQLSLPEVEAFLPTIGRPVDVPGPYQVYRIE